MNCYLCFHTLSLCDVPELCCCFLRLVTSSWGSGLTYWFSRQRPLDFWRLFNSRGAPLGLQCGRWAHPSWRRWEEVFFRWLGWWNTLHLLSFFPLCEFTHVFSHIITHSLQRACLFLFGTSSCLHLYAYLSTWIIHRQPMAVSILHGGEVLLEIISPPSVS